MKQFEDIFAARELMQRRHILVREGRVGFLDHALEIALGNIVADERRDHAQRDFGVGLAAERRDLRARKLRPCFRHVESAVSCETFDQRFVE